MTNPRILVLLLMGLSLAGCAAGPQVVQLQLHPGVKASKAGHGQSVGVTVKDQRPDRVMGYLRSKNGMQEDPVIADRNVADALSDKLQEGLSRLGFVPRRATASSSGKLRLTVDLVQLHYSPNKEGKATVRAKLKAEVVNADRHVEFTYSSMRNKSKGLFYSRADNEALVNKALDSVLDNLLHDPKLISALAGD